MKCISALAIIVGCLFSTAPGWANQQSAMCLYGCPDGMPTTNQKVERPIYILSSNRITKFADWVAYRVSADQFGPSRGRTWKKDPELGEHETLIPSDYDGANAALGVDRGHQAPLAAFAGTPHWQTTNYLSNITPQSSALNQGPWEHLEAAERRAVREGYVAVLMVLTGPFYERHFGRLPETQKQHTIPSGYWKVIYVPDGDGRIEAAAFAFDQETPRNSDYCGHLVSVEEVEVRSRLNLFPELPDQSAALLPNHRLVDYLGCELIEDTPKKARH